MPMESGEVHDVNNDVVASGDIFGWSSNNDLVATVSATGLVTAVGNGTVTITASVSGTSGTASVTVQQVATVVTVTPDAVQLTTGTATQSLSATAEDANANPIAGATFSWTSRNDNIATVDASGLVTQVAAGQATISADLDGASGFALVTSTGAFGLGSVDLWSTDNSNTTAQFTGVWGSSRSDIYAVASNGVIMNYDGTDWVQSLDDPSVNWNGVWGLGPSAILAVGNGGRLGLFDGSSWSVSIIGAGENLLAVWGTSPVDIFAVGSNGTIMHFDGSVWSAQTSGTTEVLHNVWGTSSSDVFGVGGSGTILHYDGVSWSAHTSGTTTSLFGLWGTAPDDVFVAGVSGETHHYDGASWSMMTSPNTFGINGLWGTDDADLYGVGDLGTTVVSGDAGVHTFTGGVTLGTVGEQTVTASDVAVGTITGSQTAITVEAAPAGTNFSDDFEGGLGLWSATNGIWAVGLPTSGPDECHSGVQCGGSVLDGNYPRNSSNLVSPTITLPTIGATQEIHLRFWHWFSFHSDVFGPDVGIVYIEERTGPGVWSPSTELTRYSGTSGGVWTLPLVDLSAYGGKTVRILFHINGAVSNSVSSGWYFDDVSVVTVEANNVLPYSDNFESGIGNWWASRGSWEVGGPPTAGPASCNSGTQCAATVLDGNYPINSSNLVSPTITLPVIGATQEIHLRFWHWFSFSCGRLRT